MSPWSKASGGCSLRPLARPRPRGQLRGMTKPMTEAEAPPQPHGDDARPPHRRLRMILLILGAVASVVSWTAVLFWNGCVR